MFSEDEYLALILPFQDLGEFTHLRDAVVSDVPGLILLASNAFLAPGSLPLLMTSFWKSAGLRMVRLIDHPPARRRPLSPSDKEKQTSQLCFCILRQEDGEPHQRLSDQICSRAYPHECMQSHRWIPLGLLCPTRLPPKRLLQS
jgi:hypothetical protein